MSRFLWYGTGIFCCKNLRAGPQSGISSLLDRDVSVSEALSCLVAGASCCCCLETDSSCGCCSETDSSCGCCSETDSSCGCCSETDSSCGCCSETALSCEVEGCGSEVFTSEVRFLLDVFLPGSYFLPLIVRWSFFYATAKTLTTCNCVLWN